MPVQRKSGNLLNASCNCFYSTISCLFSSTLLTFFFIQLSLLSCLLLPLLYLFCFYSTISVAVFLTSIFLDRQVVLPAWISLTLSICPYHPSLLTGLQDYILCHHRAVVGKFLSVGQHWHVHGKGFIGELYLWFSPCFSSSVPHVLFILFGWF